MATISVDVDVDEVLCELSDKQLIEEVKRRKIAQTAFLAARKVEIEEENQKCDKRLVEDTLSHLLCRRTEKAAVAMDALIRSLVPSQIVSARDSISAGRINEAIVELDRLLAPAPSATAVELPKKTGEQGDGRSRH